MPISYVILRFYRYTKDARVGLSAIGFLEEGSDIETTMRLHGHFDDLARELGYKSIICRILSESLRLWRR